MSKSQKCPTSGKNVFADEFGAAQAALAIARKTGEVGLFNVYACSDCSGFHWGHAFKADRRRAKLEASR